MAISDRKSALIDRATGFLGWVILGVVLLFVLPLGANRPVSWTLLSLFVALPFIAFFVLDAIKGFPEQMWRISYVATLFLGTIVWAYVQTVPGMPETLAHPLWSAVEGGASTISADPIRGHHHVMRLLCYGMVFWIGMRIAIDPFRAHSFIKVFAIFSTLLAVFGIYALLSGSNPILGEDLTGATLSATYVNRNNYATMAIFGFLANLFCYVKLVVDNDYYGSSTSRLRNFLENFFAGSWIYALGILLTLGAMLLSQSRAGALAGVIGLITFVSTYNLRGSKSNPIIVATLIVITLFLAFTATSGLTERLLATSEENLRFAVYPKILEGILDRPVLGHGLGGFLDAFRAYVPQTAASGEWDFAHNSFLENIFELGIPAAFAFYLALGLIAFRIFHGTYVRERDREFSAFAAACIAAGAFHSLFDFSLQMPASACVFALIMGIGWSQSFSGRKKSAKKKRKTRRTKPSSAPQELAEPTA